MNKQGFLILVLIVLVHAAIIFAIVAQTDAYRFRHLKKYLNDNCSIKIIKITEDESNDEFQNLTIRVDVKANHISLEYVASIYKALNEYANLKQDKNFRTDSSIRVWIESDDVVCGVHFKLARILNYNEHTASVGDRFIDISLRFHTNDLKYVSDIEGCEILHVILWSNSLSDDFTAKELAKNLTSIQSLQEIYVGEEWYPIFSEIDTDVEVFQEELATLN